MADSFYKDVSKYKFQSLVYPSDLNADSFYPDCVCFTIQKRTGVSIDDVTEAAGEGMKKYSQGFKGKFTRGGGKIPESLQKAIDKALAGKEEASETIRQKAEHAAITAWKDSDEGKDADLPEGMLDVIGDAAMAFGGSMVGLQKKRLDMQKDGRNIIGSIYLNMPNGIQFNEAANWGGQELGFMGKMTKDLVGGGGQDASTTAVGALTGSAGNLVGGAIGALPSLVSKLGISGGMFGAAIGAMAAGSPMQKGAEAALGIAQNPYMEMMFSGIGFRKFSFEFILRPKSTAEVGDVAKILHKFRTFTKPSFSEGSLGKSFMDYPMEFKIEFLTRGSISTYGKNVPPGGESFINNPHVPRLKNCVCDNVTSNFTPQSIWAAHEEGVPIAVTLGLSFQETELVMAEDVYQEKY